MNHTSIFNNTQELFQTNKHQFLSIKSSELDKYVILKPECQRALDSEHVNNIYTFQRRHYEKYGCFFFTNPITFGEFNRKKYILDGQHRIQTIKRLQDHYEFDLDILIVILFINSKEELDEKYTAINQNKPVSLPSNMDDWKLFTRHIDDFFQSKYYVYFSSSDRPHSPNFNKELMLKYINDNNIPEKLNYDYKLFLEEVEELNNYYKDTYSESLIYNSSNVLKYLKKARDKQPDNPFYLSVFKKFEWIERIVYKICKKVAYANMKHVSSTTRVKIKKKLRKEVWLSNFKNNFTGKCIICDNEIDYENFHCGHIISVFYNGETTLTNLVPICSTCNIDMGIKNLEEYKVELQRELE